MQIFWHLVSFAMSLVSPGGHRLIITMSTPSFSGGCQFQNISYETQLKWKRETVRKAFANFSSTSRLLRAEIRGTEQSPDRILR